MDKITQFFRELLKMRLKDKSGNIVPIIGKHKLEAKTPAITISNTGGKLISGSEKLINLKAPLLKNNPLYNDKNPKKEYYQQFRRLKNNTTVLINVWARKEQDRYFINQEIKNIIWMLKSDHNLLCPQKEDNICTNTKEKCPVNEINNHHTAKGQCPNPQKYNYYSLFSKYNIIRGSFKNNPEYNQDEIKYKQTLLRTIHPFSLEYYEYWNLHGNILLNTRNERR